MKSLVAVIAIACVACGGSTSDGIVVDVTMAGQSMPTTIVNNQGTVVAQSLVVVSLSAVDLVPCSSVSARIWRLVNPLPSAMAHTQTSPLHLGTPDAVRVAGERAETNIGKLNPPPGSYCALGLDISPADADALNLADAPGLVGNAYMAQGSADGTPFSAMTNASDYVTLPIDKLELGAGALDASLTLQLDTTHVYDGVDFASATLGTDLLLGLRGAWSVTVLR